MTPDSFNDITWDELAKHLATPDIANGIILSASATPDDHLPGYMHRFWFKRPTDLDPMQLPESPADLHQNAMRVHHILRRDEDRHLHDHPWQFRSIILSGWYREERMSANGSISVITRSKGDTYTCSQGEYHRIVQISDEPVYTLCIIGKKRARWGFIVDGVHVDSHEYLDY